MKFFFPLFIFLAVNLSSFGQEANREKETEETIDWLNSKFTEYSFKDNDVEQIFLIDRIIEVKGEYYMIGTREQRATNPLADFRGKFKIPISKINNISFSENKSTYKIDIKMKGNSEVVELTSPSGEDYGKTAGMDIILEKSIDEENLQPRILKAFDYLLELYGIKKTEKF